MIRLGAKSRFKSFAGMALSSLAAPLLIAAAFVTAGPLIAGAFSQPKLELVFCDQEGSAYFDTILSLLLADESITKTVAVKKLEYDEALDALDRGRADAVIVFPENFITDMSMGINRPIKILSGETDPVRTVFVREFMQSAASELSAAQSAINTVWFNMNHENLSGALRNLFFTTLTLEYTTKAFARSIYYTFQNVPPTYEGSSPAAFIIASALAAIVFFGSLAGVRQIIGERRTGLATRLATTGITGVKAAFYHFIPIYLKQMLCACFAVMIAFPAVIAATLPNDPPPFAAAPSPFGAEFNDLEGDGGDDIIGAVISGTLSRTGQAQGGGADGDPSAYGSSGNQGFSFADIPDIFRAAATKDNLPRLLSAFYVMSVLCLFTTSLSLFAGYMLKRPESADALVVTLGIFMAVAGGTIIPYPYLPEIFQSIGPYCFNRHAQGLIASALYGRGGNTAGAAISAVIDNGGTALAVFAAIAALLTVLSVVRIKREYI